MKPGTILKTVLLVAAMIAALYLLSGCTNDDTDTTIRFGWFSRMYVTDHYAAGMHYRIFHLSDSGGLGVVNVTLDSLQAEQLKQKP